MPAEHMRERTSSCGLSWLEVAKGNVLPEQDIIRITEFLGGSSPGDLCHLPWRGNIDATLRDRVVERITIAGSDGAGLSLSPGSGSGNAAELLASVEAIYLCEQLLEGTTIPFVLMVVFARSDDYKPLGDQPRLICRVDDLAQVIGPLQIDGRAGTVWRNGRTDRASGIRRFEKGDFVLDEVLVGQIISDSVDFLVGDVGERLRGWKVPAKRGIILHGPPGNGKTVLTRLVAHRALEAGLSVSIIEYRPPTSAFNFGPTLSDLLLDTRSRSPSLIIFEDIDMHCGSRTGTTNALSTREPLPLSQLTDFLDGVEPTDGYVLLATTNVLSELDPALRRTGRLDVVYEIGPPNLDTRQRVLEKLLGNGPSPVPDTEAAAAILNGASMSDVAEAARRHLLSLAERPETNSLASLERAAQDVAGERALLVDAKGDA